MKDETHHIEDEKQEEKMINWKKSNMKVNNCQCLRLS